MDRTRLALFSFGVTLLLGAPGLADDEPADPRRLRADHAPTPYSAVEIAAGCAHGRTTVFEVETPQGKVRQRTRFLLPDAEGVEIEFCTLNARGEPVGQPREGRAPWTSLQRHASFPANLTKIARGSTTTPVGTFACRIYTVQTPSGKRTFYFADDLPGPPVRMVAVDTAGKPVLSMTLVENVPFDFPTYFGDQEWEGRAVRERVEFAASASLVLRRGKHARAVVVASLRILDGAPVRHAALRVTSGTLRGAVLRLTPEQPDTQGKMIVAREFELPERWRHSPGPLECELIDLR